jgi:hypothetical protein
MNDIQYIFARARELGFPLPETHWCTREGEFVLWTDLEPSHLQNIERMLRGDGESHPRSIINPTIVNLHRYALREMARRELPPLPPFELPLGATRLEIDPLSWADRAKPHTDRYRPNNEESSY